LFEFGLLTIRVVQFLHTRTRPNRSTIIRNAESRDAE